MKSFKKIMIVNRYVNFLCLSCSKVLIQIIFCVLGDVGELEPLKDDETMFVYRGLEDKFKE